MFSQVEHIVIRARDDVCAPHWGESPGYLYYLAKHATFPKIYVGTMEAEIIATHENVDIFDRKVLQKKKEKLWQQIKEVIPYRITSIF